MSHTSKIIDADAFFEVIPHTRQIINKTPQKSNLIQYDHNSERFTFSLPRYIDGHDMSETDKAEVYYINIDAETGEKTEGNYEMTDLQIDAENEEKVHCSWLISQNATKRIGLLSFLLRFSCFGEDGSTVEYAWNTAIYSGISVEEGIYNPETIIEQYTDVLEQWKAALFEINDDGVKNVREASAEAMENIKGAADEVNEAKESAMEKISTAADNFDKTAKNAGESIETGKNNALTEIQTSKENALENMSESKANFDTAARKATEDLEAVKNEAQKAIEAEKVEAAEVVAYEKGLAIEGINKIKEEAAEDIENNGGTLFANALKSKATGKVIRVDGVSPVEHTAKAKVYGKNFFNALKVSTTGQLNDYAYISSVSEGTVVVYSNETDNGYCNSGKTLRKICGDIETGKVYTLSANTESAKRKYLYLTGAEVRWDFGTARTLTEGMLDSVVVFYGLDNDEGNGNCAISNIQLELGEAVIEYEPFIDPTTVTVSRCGKNLFDITNLIGKTATMNGVTVDVLEDGCIYVHGKPVDTSTSTSITISHSEAVDVFPKGAYVYGNNPLVNDNNVYCFPQANRPGNKAWIVNINKTATEVPEEFCMDRFVVYVKEGTTREVHAKFYLQTEAGGEASGYEAYKKVLTCTPSADGTVEFPSVSPAMTLLSDNEGITIDVEYNQDTNKALENVNEDIKTLDNDMAVLSAEVINLANKVAPSPASVTLYADRWEQDEEDIRYHQEVAVANATITPSSKVDLQLSAEQITIFYEKDLAFVAENEDGVVTVYCIGQVPENDYVIQATVSEVVVNG